MVTSYGLKYGYLICILVYLSQHEPLRQSILKNFHQDRIILPVREVFDPDPVPFFEGVGPFIGEHGLYGLQGPSFGQRGEA